MPSWNCKGDLTINGRKLEVKCYTSNGPSSFGPTESWNIIYFLDARNFLKRHLTCWRVALSNTSSKWKSIKVNKAQTFDDQCKQGRRPRMSFEDIRKYIPNTHVECIYDGSFDDIFKTKP
jgi:hypothetical protein